MQKRKEKCKKLTKTSEKALNFEAPTVNPTIAKGTSHISPDNK
jgi:hypothetical protein